MCLAHSRHAWFGAGSAKRPGRSERVLHEALLPVDTWWTWAWTTPGSM
jgi:hypothetical protein